MPKTKKQAKTAARPKGVVIHDPSSNGPVEFTQAKLESMKTAEVALLVAAVRGDANVTEPKDKATAIEMFWKAVEAHPEKAKKPETEAPKPMRKGKLYSVVPATSRAQQEAFEGFEPMVKKFVESLREAGQPLTMAECSAILSKASKTGNPAKHASWIFCSRLRPAGLLVEERG